jgi:hypothetical protein
MKAVITSAALAILLAGCGNAYKNGVASDCYTATSGQVICPSAQRAASAPTYVYVPTYAPSAPPASVDYSGIFAQHERSPFADMPPPPMPRSATIYHRSMGNVPYGLGVPDIFGPQSTIVFD